MNTRIPPGPGAVPMPSRRLFVQGLAAGGVVANSVISKIDGEDVGVLHRNQLLTKLRLAARPLTVEFTLPPEPKRPSSPLSQRLAASLSSVSRPTSPAK